MHFLSWTFGALLPASLWHVLLWLLPWLLFCHHAIPLIRSRFLLLLPGTCALPLQSPMLSHSGSAQHDPKAFFVMKKPTLKLLLAGFQVYGGTHKTVGGAFKHSTRKFLGGHTLVLQFPPSPCGLLGVPLCATRCSKHAWQMLALRCGPRATSSAFALRRGVDGT